MVAIMIRVIVFLLSFGIILILFALIEKHRGKKMNPALVISAAGALAGVLTFVFPEDAVKIVENSVHMTSLFSNNQGPVTQNASNGNNISVNVNGDNNHIEMTMNVGGGDDNDSGETAYQKSEEPKEKVNSDKYETRETYTVGWRDSSESGRKSYTIDEINNGVLGNRIVFNSIADDSLIGSGVLHDEKNFVGARENTGINAGKDNVWSPNEIVATPDTTYLIRLYAHNNSPNGTDAVAEDVKLRFDISDPVYVTNGDDIDIDNFDASEGYYAVAVHGYITSSNADPDMYSDGVKFVSNRPFHLMYVPGTATIESNGIGARTAGYPLDNKIMSEGVLIGYENLDGNIPGCYNYASYTTIVVVPVFE